MSVASITLGQVRAATMPGVRPSRLSRIVCPPLGLLAMLLVLTPQSMFNELPRFLVVWGTFAITLVLGLIGYAAAKEAGLNPWTTPVALNAVYYFIRYGWGTVATEYWEDYPWETTPLLRMNFRRFGVWENLPGGC